MDHVSGHIRQTGVTPAVAVCQLLMADAHEVNNRGVRVMHMDGIFDGPEAEVEAPPADPNAGAREDAFLKELGLS